MTFNFPPVADVRTALAAMTHAEIQKLALDSGVPFTTLWKIRVGTTQNPGIETVRLFFEHLPSKAATSSGGKAAPTTDHAKAAKKAPREQRDDGRDKSRKSSRRSDGKPSNRNGR